MNCSLTHLPTQTFKFLTGFEGTHIYGAGTDVLQTTKHTERFVEDLDRLALDGIEMFRACIPWHTVEREQGKYDWSWVDKYLAHAQLRALTPIVDPLHHTSTPEWLTLGFADPLLKSAYVRFITAFAKRYPWVTHYTVMNEPFVTLWLAGHCEIWHPFYGGDQKFVPMLVNACRMINEATFKLQEIVTGLVLVHVDTCERHVAFEQESYAHVEKSNHLRFIALDLILGRVNLHHPMYSYLLQNGASTKDLQWFITNPATIDILGLDYYSHSEVGWTNAGRGKNYAVVGFKTTALEYVEHFRDYKFPIMLTETNLRGTVTDRLSWLKYMVGECEQLQIALSEYNIPFLGFCWYPYIDSTDWCHLVAAKHTCTNPMCVTQGHIDPQGIVWLDKELTRHSSELSEVYAALASGQIDSAKIPAYEFGPEVLVERGVNNYLLLLSHWDWISVSP